MRIKFFLIAIFLSPFIAVSQNLLYNGSFEEGDHIGDNLHYDMIINNRLDNWEGQCSNCDDNHLNNDPYYHSPDWYDYNFGYCGTTPNEGERMIGMDQYELIQQKYNADFSEGDILYLRLNIFKRLSNPGGYLNDFSNVYLNVYFAKQKIKYKEDEPINGDYCEHRDQVGQSIITKSFNISGPSYPIDEWKKISMFFEAPDPSYNWFAIEVVTPGGSCNSEGVAYINIDDVQLMHYCSHPCMTDLPPVELLSVIPNACIPNDNTYVWHIEVRNAQRIDLILTDGAGGTHEFTDFDVNGLVDDQWGLDYYTFIWNGYGESLSAWPLGTYAYRLILSNCSSEPLEYFGGITLIPNGTPFIVPQVQEFAFDNEDCCQANIFLSNIVDDSHFYVASNSIETGGSYYSIPSGESITFDAGEEIILGNGFNAEFGSNFTAKIGGCQPLSRSQDRNYDLSNNDFSVIDAKLSNSSLLSKPVEFDDMSLRVFPNPTSSTVNIESNFLIQYVDVFTELGNLWFSFDQILSNSFKFDASKLPQGVYYIHVISINGLSINKILIVSH